MYTDLEKGAICRLSSKVHVLISQWSLAALTIHNQPTIIYSSASFLPIIYLKWHYATRGLNTSFRARLFNHALKFFFKLLLMIDKKKIQNNIGDCHFPWLSPGTYKMECL